MIEVPGKLRTVTEEWNKALREMSEDPKVKSRFMQGKVVMAFRSSLEMKEKATKDLKEAAELYPPTK